MQVRSKVWLEKDRALVFGVGKSSILRAVQETGSINQAAKAMKMSFRHAWSYIHSAERRLGNSLLVKTKGGRKGGGASLTAYAIDLLDKFEKLEQEVEKFTNQRFKEIFRQ